MEDLGYILLQLLIIVTLVAGILVTNVFLLLVAAVLKTEVCFL